MKKIVVIGSLNMDIVTRVDYTPKIGETVIGKGFEQIPGGKGANQAATLGKLGADVKLIGKVGEDDFGLKLIENLRELMVDTSSIKIDVNNTTGIAMIMINKNGDNSIAVIPGANYNLQIEDISIKDIQQGDIILAQLETPINTVKELFKIAKEEGKYIVLNPAPAQPLDDEIISCINLLITNETEFEILTGLNCDKEDNIKQGAKILFKRGVKELILTLGERGSIYLTNNEYIKINSYKVKAVDTTGAGDSFIGGLLYQKSLGKDIKTSLLFASKVAALTVTKKGAQTSLPTFEEVINFKGDVNNEKR